MQWKSEKILYSKCIETRCYSFKSIEFYNIKDSVSRSCLPFQCIIDKPLAAWNLYTKNLLYLWIGHCEVRHSLPSFMSGTDHNLRQVDMKWYLQRCLVPTHKMKKSICLNTCEDCLVTWIQNYQYNNLRVKVIWCLIF